MVGNKCYIVERFGGQLDQRALTLEDATVAKDVEQYLADSLEAIRDLEGYATVAPQRNPGRRPVDVACEVYDVLTSRAFATCSRSESQSLKDLTLARIASFVARNAPIRFYLDLGGGYSAAVHLDDVSSTDSPAGLGFSPNLLHVLCLAQIARFTKRIRAIYQPGIRMILVIDNLVAAYVNDIPLLKTLGFCRQLQHLIGRLDLEQLVEVLPESEVSIFSRDELAVTPPGEDAVLNEREYENVVRFSGRMLSRSEAARRLRLYAEATRLSGRHLAAVIDGVHLTQRKAADTLSFRSFPGGCARIQTGRACFLRNPCGRVIPKLLTTSNVSLFQIFFVPTTLSAFCTSDPIRDATAPLTAAYAVTSL